MKSTSRMIKGMLTILLSLTVVVFATETFAQGTWTTKAAMPTARSGPAVGVISGNLYVAGGCCVFHSPPYPRFNVLEVYDPATNIWTTKAPIPTAVYAVADGVIDGKLYVAGGQASQTDGTNIATLQVYEPATDTWSIKAPMPFASSSAAAGVIDGKLYVAGGLNPPNTEVINTLRVYDPATDTWVIKASMPTARHSAGGGVVNGILYVIGGVNNATMWVATVEAYDPATDTWTTKTPMPTARYGPAVGMINGILYAVGGYNGSGLAIAEAYDPVTNTWTAQPPMPTARWVLGGGVANGILYAVGGFITPGSQTAANEAFTPESVLPPPPSLPTTTDQCKNGGWQTFGVFKNQGDCVSFIATKGKNPPFTPGKNPFGPIGR